MQKLAQIVDGVLLCDQVDALDLPPTLPNYATVPTAWNGVDADAVIAKSWELGAAGRGGTTPQLDLELWATDDRTLTNAELFGASRHPIPDAVEISTEAIPAVRASLDLATKTANCDTVVEIDDDSLIGLAGNDVTLAFQAGSTVDVGELDVSGFPALLFKYKTLVTINSDFESAVLAAQLTSKIRVKTPSASPGTALVAIVDAFAAANLVDGADAFVATDGPHGMLTGDGPIQWEMAAPGTPPERTSVGKDYWVIVGGDPAQYQIAETLHDALAGKFIQFFDAPETQDMVTLSDERTQRIWWTSHGLLGPAHDGTIVLGAQRAWWETVEHRPRVFAYGIVATLNGDPGLVSASLYPVVDNVT